MEVEAVFGQIKWNKGYKRFRHVGLEKIIMDFGILAIAFNIGKMISKGKKTKKKGAGAAHANNRERKISAIVAIFYKWDTNYRKDTNKLIK